MCGTGIFAWNNKNKEGAISKRALAGADFINSQQFDQYKDIVGDVNLAIGHNRASTIGSAKDINCHPFQYDHISLVHNGTLRNYHNLVKGFNHAVDSAYAAKAIAEYGAVEALSKIDGAFVFVWHNLEDNTLNIARNGMRDIWFIADKEGENLFFASEYLTMDFVRARNGFDVHGQYRSPTEFTMISWNLDKPFLKPKATKFEEYKPPKYEPPYKGSYNGGYGTWMNKDEKELKELGLSQYSSVLIKDAVWSAYSEYNQNDNTTGTILGKTVVTLDNKECEYGTRIHSVTKKEWEEKYRDAPELYAQVCNCWWDKSTPIVTSRYPSTAKWEDSAVSNLPQIEKTYLGPYKTSLSKAQFEELVGGGCCYCGDPLTVNDDKEITWIKWGRDFEPLCRKCACDPATREELRGYESALMDWSISEDDNDDIGYGMQ